MKKTILISTALLMTSLAFAQNSGKQYKVNFSGANKKVQILSGANQLTIEGYSGSEVILEAENGNKEFPEEAEGLKIISAGAVDNTGTGANVTTEGNNLQIKIPKSRYFGNFKVKIPKEVAISIKESGNNYGKWFIGGFDGEVEVSTSYSTVNIKSVTGPLIARCGYGKISVVYDKVNPTKPNSISAAGAVDVTLPSDTKANLRLESSFGDVFTDFDLVESVAKDKKSGEDNEIKTTTVTPETKATTIAATSPTPRVPAVAKVGSWSGQNNNVTWDGKEWKVSDDCNCDNSNYTINGGGVNIRLHSDHGNIYLRKKK